jgi:phospholipase/lecithinase/hemolysin
MRWAAGILLMGMIPAATLLAAEPVKRMYVFGDSYSDTGFGYVDGNGPTAVWYLAKRLGFELYPASVKEPEGKSLNFAVSGADTGWHDWIPMGDARLGYGMRNQVRDFVEMVKAGRVKFDAKTTVFFIAGGLNDGRFKTQYTSGNLQAEIEDLYAVGARRFEVAILPAAIPGFDVTSLRLNPMLVAIPAAMQSKLLGAVIATSHWGAFFDDVYVNAAKYGIADKKNACAGRVIFHQDTKPCANPDGHYFYHADHPSTAVHRAVGEMLFAEMSHR